MLAWEGGRIGVGMVTQVETEEAHAPLPLVARLPGMGLECLADVDDSKALRCLHLGEVAAREACEHVAPLTVPCCLTRARTTSSWRQ